jgi:hypothetical protein
VLRERIELSTSPLPRERPQGKLKPFQVILRWAVGRLAPFRARYVLLKSSFELGSTLYASELAKRFYCSSFIIHHFGIFSSCKAEVSRSSCLSSHINPLASASQSGNSTVIMSPSSPP